MERLQCRVICNNAVVFAVIQIEIEMVLICYRIIAALSARRNTEFFVMNFFTSKWVNLPRGWANNPMLQGIFHQLVAVHQAQFDHDPGAIGIDGARADADLVADFPAGVSSGGQL